MQKMIKKLILCLETNSKADTDYQYVKATIDFFYNTGTKNVIRPVYMESKTRYREKKVLQSIANEQKGFDDVHVIYCIDTDEYASNPDAINQLAVIRDFCDEHSYDFVFFCREVEEVYWGNRVIAHDKIAKAARFKRQEIIRSVDESKLRREQYSIQASNILLVLDKYLPRK